MTATRRADAVTRLARPTSSRSGELQAPGDGQEMLERYFGPAHFSHVDLEKADRVELERSYCRLVAMDIWRPLDPVP